MSRMSVSHDQGNVPNPGSRASLNSHTVRLIQVASPSESLSGTENPVFTVELTDTADKWAGEASHSIPRLKRSSTPRESCPNQSGLRRFSLASTVPEPDKLSVRRGQTVHSIRIESDGSSGTPGSSKSSWSELMRLKIKHPSISIDSENGSRTSLSGVSSVMSERLRDLRRKFTSRTEYFKEKTAAPPTPSDNEDDLDKDAHDKEDHFFFESPKHKPDEEAEEEKYFKCGKCRMKIPKMFSKLNLEATIEPQSRWYVLWLFVVSVAFMYNAWAIPLRACFFNMQNERTLPYWLACDYIADLLYILDIVLVKCRIGFINNGIVDNRFSETKKHYLSRTDFKLDVFSLLPLDIFYFALGKVNPLLRLTRVLKFRTFWEFFDRFDQAAKSGHIIRIFKTCLYMLYLIHIECCGYYTVSYLQGFDSSDWVFNPKRQNVTPYLRCFYLATKTATSIGKNPLPTNDFEYMFMTFYWLSGVFVFASLIGQIRDIVEAAGAVKSNYRKTMDITIWYMQSLNLPNDLQNRVRTWFNYNWDQQKTLNENTLIETLPRKMRTDLAIHVHFQTLSKVKLFQDCDKNLLYDLVLKLKPVLYLPGDYICSKGEVGTEMYIVMNGSVQVVGGPNNDTVFATLHMGSVFGEISLLALSGGNRRTADVRSKGFSNLFLLSKADFDEAMSDYPEAAILLRKRSQKLLNQNKTIDKTTKPEPESIPVVTEREPTPKLLKTVIKVVKPGSSVLRYLSRSHNQIHPAPSMKVKLARSVTDIIRDSLTPDDPVLPDLSPVPPVTPDLSPVPSEHSPVLADDQDFEDAISQMSEEDISLPDESQPINDLVESRPINDPDGSQPINDLDETDDDDYLDSIIADTESELHAGKVTPAPGQGVRIVNEIDDRKSPQPSVRSPPRKVVSSGSSLRSERSLVESKTSLNSSPVDQSPVYKPVHNIRISGPTSATPVPSNVVTCSVEIHREQTPAASDPTR